MKSSSRHIFLPLQLTFLLIATFLLGGCTHNDGNIGFWFGTWDVKEILRDGRPLTNIQGHFYICFQNNIIKIIHTGAYGYDKDGPSCFGTWEEGSENSLTFNFTHHDDTDSNVYLPFDELEFPHDKPITLSYVKKNSGNVTLSYLNPETGTEMKYVISKQ